MKTIMCFGDSNTYGYIPKTADRYDEDVRWTGILNHRVKDLGYRVVEEGLVGRTTVFPDNLRPGRKGSEFLPVLMESHYPVDTVVLMLGTNDCKTVYGASPEVIGKGIEKLLRQIKAANENTKILLVSPIYLGENVWREEFDPEFDEKSVETSKRLKDVYIRLATEYGCDFLAASDVADPSAADQEHLTEEGHRALAEAIFTALQSRKIYQKGGR